VEEPQEVGDLEIHQDLPFERRNWRAQRIGWAVIGLFVLAGLAGLFGRGPLASATRTSQRGALRVDYERFTRHGSPAELRVTVAPQALEAATVRILVSLSYLQGLQVEGVEPPPESVLISGDYLVYSFDVEAGQPARILFRVIPDQYFLRTAEVGLTHGRERVGFRQFVFP